MKGPPHQGRPWKAVVGCFAAWSGVPWSDKAGGEQGSRGEKRPSSEPTDSWLSELLTVPPLWWCAGLSTESVCVYVRLFVCVYLCVQSMSGGGNTVLLTLTLARFCYEDYSNSTSTCWTFDLNYWEGIKYFHCLPNKTSCGGILIGFPGFLPEISPINTDKNTLAPR